MGNAGTFVGAKLTEDCADRLVEWMTQQGIPNPTPKEELHCTVVYSEEREIKIAPLAYEPPLEIDPNRFRFKHFGDNREVLVLTFDRPELAHRHAMLRKKYDLSWKFPSYIPHVTLSYNAPDHLDAVPDFPLVFRGEEVGPFSPPEDSAAAEHMNEEMLPSVKTKTPEQVAIKHGVPLKQIQDQLRMGIKVEQEHTKDPRLAHEIALDHLLELPDYYTRLKKIEEWYEIVNDEPVRKKKRPEPPKKLIAQNLVKLGLKEDEDRVSVQQGNAQQLSYTGAMRQNAVGQKCQVVVQMPVLDFLRLTTTDDADIEAIFRKDAHPLDSYNHWNRMGDEPEYAAQVNQGLDRSSKEYKWGRVVGPFLRIEIEPPVGTLGRVTGHEGRHRAAAVMNAGGKVIPVALCLRPFKGMFPKSWGPEYELHADHIPMAVHGQFRPVKVTTRNWKVIEPDLLKPYRKPMRESTLFEVAGTFSWFHPKTEKEITAEFGTNEHWDLVQANPEAFGTTEEEVNQPSATLEIVLRKGWVRVNYYKGVWYFQGLTKDLVQATAAHYAWSHEGLHEIVADIGDRSYTLMGPAIEKFIKHGVLPEWR